MPQKISCMNPSYLSSCFFCIAPSYPQILYANSSAFYIYFSFLSPTAPNGIIRYYLVTYFPYNEPSNVVEMHIDPSGSNERPGSNERQVFITDLTPDTFYTFTVAAFTVALGPSDQRSIRTQEGSKYYLHVCLGVVIV